MTRLRPDGPCLVLGVAAIALGVSAWAGRLGQLINHPAAALPALAGLLGLSIIASARRSPTGGPQGRPIANVDADGPEPPPASATT